MTNAHDRYLERARLLLQQSRFDLAEPELRRSIGEDPTCSEAYALLALCLAERKRWGEATEAAAQGVGLDPQDPFAHYVRARVFADRNMRAEAREALGPSLELDPSNPSAWALRARIELADGNHRAAQDAAERGLECDPEHEACVNLRAIALTQQGDRAGAAQAIDSTLSRNPLNAASHANMGWTLLHGGQARKAMEHFREALRLDPQMEWARMGIVEAMKARNVIYRVFLAYFLFMGRLSANARWGIIVGAWLVPKIMSGVAKAYPSLGTSTTVVKVAYLTFALGTVVSVPLFNLFLLMDSFGRLVLSRGQRIGAAVFGLTLIPPVVFVVLWAVRGPGVYGLCALVSAVVALPVSLAGMAAAGMARRAMTGIACAMAGTGVAICWLLLTGRVVPESLQWGHLIGCVGSTWLSNALASRGDRRLD